MRTALFHSVAVCCVVAVGCSTNPLGTDSGAPPVDMAMASTGSPPDLAGYGEVKLEIGPIQLDPGQERTICSIVRLPTTRAINVVKIAATLLPGSHHLIVYRSLETEEKPGPFGCTALADVGGLGGGTPQNVPLYIAETMDNNTLPLPSGVAYRLEPGQMIKLEAHYLNATSKPIMGKGTVRLTTAPTDQQLEKADIMFCGSVTPLYLTGVPPGPSSLPPGFYRPPEGTKVFGLTTHQHKRGSLMEMWKSVGVNDEAGTKLVDGKPWDEPPFVIYDDANLLTFEGDEGLRWRCHYDNPNSKTYRFGQSAEKDEMCFFWAYYYPSADKFLSMGDCWR